MTETSPKSAMSIDHIGVDLWRAFRAYEEAMFEGIRAAGFEDLTLADSDVLAFVGPDGTRSGEIAKSRRITKQAAQEQVQRLIARGYLRMEPDPQDRRAKLVTLTQKGQDMMVAFVAIKRDLHARVSEALGPTETARLRKALSDIETVLTRDERA